MESIAIIGIGCRFPNANDPELFWSLLQNGGEAFSDIPSDRWDIDAFYDPDPMCPGKMNTRQGGFLENFTQFDPSFFEILPKEAKRIDPHQRLVLEVAWESLEYAGLIPATLAGSKTGVFIGMSQSDHNRLLLKDFSSIDAGDGPNTFLCFAANRLSYFLNLHGPSLAIDTACSSSLVAVHLACQSLRSGECDLALSGGVNLILSPEIFISLSQKGQLSPEGRCKTFDASADGFVRGEGGGILVLKRLSDAIKEGDHILATIRGSAVNQNGFSRSITAPNGLAQQELIRQALNNAGVKPNEISYVEAHGTASYLGDSIEFQSLKAVLMEGRSLDQPCYFGSVKSNIGHLEAAAGIASLIKVVLSLQHKEIPPTLHLEHLNPYISLEGTPFLIPTNCQSWFPNTDYRLAGVSSFGFGGTNCHVILEEAPGLAEVTAGKIERPLHILTLSAKSKKALQVLVSRYEDFLANHPKASLADICFTANTGRSQFKHRLAIITESKEQLSEQLNIFLQQELSPNILSGQITKQKPLPICFVFSGKSHKLKPLIKLYKSSPAFNSFLESLELVFYSHTNKSFLELIKIEEDKLENSLHSQLIDLFCECAIVQLFRLSGIEPTTTIGYGTGNYTALVLAEILDLEDVIALIFKKEDLKFCINFKSAKIPIVSSITGNTIQVDQVIDFEQWQKGFDFNNSKEEKMPDSLSDHNQILLDINSIQIKNCTIETIRFYDVKYDIKNDNLYSLFFIVINFWLMGVKIDWSKIEDYEQCCRISLPTYPFERQSYWINVLSSALNNEDKITNNENKLEQLDKKFVAPRNEIERQLANIWQKVLGHKSIGIHDDFFALGGDSRLSALLVSEIEKTFNKPFSLVSFFQFPTITEISRLISEPSVDLPKTEFTTKLDLKHYQKFLTIALGRPGLRPSKNSLMVALNSQNNKQPFFFCANSMSHATSLNKYLETKYSCYLLETGYSVFLETGYSVFFRENRVTAKNIKALAFHHLQDILSIQSEGSYLLAGYSFGSLVAYEIAKQLEEQGRKVAFLGILDTQGNDPRLKYFDVIHKWEVRFKNLTKLIIAKNFAEIYLESRKIISNFIIKLEIILKSLTRLIVNKKLEKTNHDFDSTTKSTYVPNTTLEQYVMDGYQGKITLFLAQGRIDSSLTRKLTSLLFHGYGWTRESLSEVYKVPGDHHTMAREPYVKLLAEKLAFHLEKNLPE